jgi:long-chain acyl-CoA synthetase
VVRVTLDADAPVAPEPGRPFTLDLPDGHPCAWIFTSGTSGALSKLTEITFENLEAAVENIQDLDFLHPGMTLHSPLSASHIFAFVAILGFLTVKPRRMIFSDVQYLARLPRSTTGKVDGLILVPIVMNRMRSAFYEKLTSNLDVRKVPVEAKRLARIPLRVRKLLKRMFLRSEQAMVTYETTGRVDLSGRLAIALLRKIFGPLFSSKLGSPDFVVVGGAKPNLQAMAFLEIMGIRCLQGWGMTETTGPLSVCRLGDRFRGAFGTCGTLFRETNAYIEDGELVVEGPQIAHGYHEPDGSFTAFNGRKRTGDHAEIDASGRLKVLGKASDRITTDNGINYNPIPFEERLHALDLAGQNFCEEVVVIGDAKPRLGAVVFLREGVENTGATHAYVTKLIDTFNANRAVDERIASWTISDQLLKEAGVLGPSGKLIRRRVEDTYANIFGPHVVPA